MRTVIRDLLPICLIAFLSGVTIFAEAQQQEGQPGAAVERSQEDPTKGSKDIDQVLQHPLAVILQAAKRAVATYGCEIRKETAGSFECTRSRHIGIFVGSGGEKVTVQLQAVASGTRVRIKTGKGFVGRLGKKNWSTPIFNEMVGLLQAS